ncbi:MAG: hypothetical protein KF809_15150 [Chloroflexi bacterium]|nr:hypothetical protein [Chloroflexota bacterium]
MTTPPDDREVDDLLGTLAAGPSPDIRRTIDARVTTALRTEADRRTHRTSRTVSRSTSLAMAVVAGVALMMAATAVLVMQDDQRPVIIGASSPAASASPSAASATSPAVSPSPAASATSPSASPSPAVSLLPACGPSGPIEVEATPEVRGMIPGRSKRSLGDDLTIDDLRAAGFVIPLPDDSYGFVDTRIYRDRSRASVLLSSEPIDPHDREDRILRRGGVSITEWKGVDGSYIESIRQTSLGLASGFSLPHGGRSGSTPAPPQVAPSAREVMVGPYPAVLQLSIRWVREQFLWEVWWHAEGHDYHLLSGLQTGAEAVDVARSMVCGGG